MSCCNGWKMSNSATSERNAPTRNAAPPAAGKYQASLLKPVVVILGLCGHWLPVSKDGPFAIVYAIRGLTPCRLP